MGALAGWLVENLGTIKEVLEISVICIGAGWFILGWVVRNGLDASVEFNVEVNLISTNASSRKRTVELAADLHNQTGIAARIKKIAWHTSEDPNEHQWKTPYGKKSLLIRHGNWRLVDTAQIATDKPVVLFAECLVDWQSRAKTLYFQKIIPPMSAGNTSMTAAGSS